MKTSELSSMALDFAVAVAEGWQDYETEDYGFSWHAERGSAWLSLFAFQPSQLWDQGGPIIERELISVARVGPTLPDAMSPHSACWCAHIDGAHACYGDTPLTAAMRCYVASKLGDEIELPEGLI